jgi:hypothetical protein
MPLMRGSKMSSQTPKETHSIFAARPVASRLPRLAAAPPTSGTTCNRRHARMKMKASVLTPRQGMTGSIYHPPNGYNHFKHPLD